MSATDRPDHPIDRARLAKAVPQFTIWKEFSFAAAHRLSQLPENHQCSRLHGHTYIVRFHVSGELDPSLEWVFDLGALGLAWEPIKRAIDHRTLNDLEGLENPTVEVLAQWLWRRMALSLPPRVTLTQVDVQESPTSGVRLCV